MVKKLFARNILKIKKMLHLGIVVLMILCGANLVILAYANLPTGGWQGITGVVIIGIIIIAGVIELFTVKMGKKEIE